MESFIGKKIEGRYEISELIGVGGMANVYKAYDVTDGKAVAVKILREEYYDNDEFLRRFKNESKAIALLDHPNIVKVYDVCFSKGMQMIVMEYLDGITLKEFMQQQDKLSWKEALHFTCQILKALSHAHSRGIVHRDMKPQNVMLLPDGTVKLADFGIARFARSEAKTLTDNAIGSVHYISPEQARGEDTDQRADLYSVGVMMFEMLTGQLPFDADSPVSVALKQIQLEAPSVTSIDSSIPEGLDKIISKAMEKSPEQRYQTADEMLGSITAFKHNPNAVFEYKYLQNNDLQDIKYKRAIKKARQEEKGSKNRYFGKVGGPQSVRAPRKEVEYEEEDRGRSVIMVLGGITVAFMVISAVFIFTMLYLNNPLEKVPDIKVPDLIGLKYDSIKAAPEYENFEIVAEESRFNELHPKGAVIEQYPKSGKTVKVNSVIKVTISKGAQIVAVPNVIGLEETVAYHAIDEAGLDYEKVEIFSFEGAGTVIGTEPGAGSEVSSGTKVKVIISMGPENTVVSVPDLVGKTLDEARNILESTGLKVGGLSYIVSEKPYETIIAQDPSVGSQIAVGGYVNLNVSGGEQQSNRVTAEIPLPKDVNEEVKLTARYKDQNLREERVIPSQALRWRPVFEGKGEVDIHILYNDFLYMTIRINFNDGSWSVIEDNTEAHN